MKKPEGMMFWVKDWRSNLDVAAMSPVQRSIYFELLCAMWINGGYLPNDEKTLAAAARVPLKVFRRESDRVLSNCFETPLGLTNQKLLTTYEQTVNVLKRKSEGGKKRQESCKSPDKSPGKSPSASVSVSVSKESSNEDSYPPVAPLTANDWAPWADAEQARDEILAVYPKGNHKAAPARAWWQNFIVETPNAPAIARRMLDAAKYVRDNCPPDKLGYLPNAWDFLSGDWQRDWAKEWETPQKPGKLGSLMRELEELAREA